MTTRTLAALLSLAFAALPATRGARADEPKQVAPAPGAYEEASRRFKSGVGFYKDKDFAAALVEFKRAYELVPNPAVLYNLGQTARELRDHAAALSAFEQYLRDSGSRVPTSRRKEVGAAIEELKKKVGALKIVATVDGAAITVDDVSVGASPLAAPVIVNVGRHKLSATSSGYSPAQRVVDVASMEETTVTFDLAKLDAGPAKVVLVEAPPKKGPPIVAWVMLGTTGAFAIATAVTGGLAVSAHGGLTQALATFPGDKQAIADAQSRTRTFAIATDVLGAIAIAGGATTAVLFVLAGRSPEKAKTSVFVSPVGGGVGGVF